MKSALIITLLAFAASGLQAAKDEKLPAIPKEKEGRWGVFSFDEAKKEAAKRKRPLAFVLQQQETPDVELSVKEAALRAFWGVEKDCIMVVLASGLLGEGKTRLSAAAYGGLTAPTMGKGYPRLVVTDSTGEKVLGHMTSDQLIGADEKVMKAFSRQMEDYNKDPSKVPATAAAAPAPAAPGAPAATAPVPAAAATAPAAGPVAIKDAKPENWTNAQGRTIQATLVEVNGDQLTLLLPNGQKVPISQATLAPDSQKRAEALKAASAK